MYGIFTYIYHKFRWNVGKYTIHGASGYHPTVLAPAKVYHLLRGSLCWIGGDVSQGESQGLDVDVFFFSRDVPSDISDNWVVVSNIVSPLPGEMIQFDSYFSKGLKPPARQWWSKSHIWMVPWKKTPISGRTEKSSWKKYVLRKSWCWLKLGARNVSCHVDVFFQNFHSGWNFLLQFQGRAQISLAKTSCWKMTGFSIYWMGCLGPCLALSNGHPIPQFQSQTSPTNHQFIIVRDIILPRKTHECHVNIKGWVWWNFLLE